MITVEIHNGKGINIPDANLVRVTSTEEVINLINLSKTNRAVTPTDTDDGGRCSHTCVFIPPCKSLYIFFLSFCYNEIKR